MDFGRGGNKWIGSGQTIEDEDVVKDEIKLMYTVCTVPDCSLYVRCCCSLLLSLRFGLGRHQPTGPAMIQNIPRELTVVLERHALGEEERRDICEDTYE